MACRLLNTRQAIVSGECYVPDQPAWIFALSESFRPVGHLRHRPVYCPHVLRDGGRPACGGLHQRTGRYTPAGPPPGRERNLSRQPVQQQQRPGLHPNPVVTGLYRILRRGPAGHGRWKRSDCAHGQVLEGPGSCGLERRRPYSLSDEWQFAGGCFLERIASLPRPSRTDYGPRQLAGGAFTSFSCPCR